MLVGVLQGTIPGQKHSYRLDDGHEFVTDKPMLVCGNSAAMVGEQGKSWLRHHFEVAWLSLAAAMAILALLHWEQSCVMLSHGLPCHPLLANHLSNQLCWSSLLPVAL